MGWGGLDWIVLAQDSDRWLALVNAVMNLLFPYNTGNFLIIWGTDSFPGRAPLRGVSSKDVFSYRCWFRRYWKEPAPGRVSVYSHKKELLCKILSWDIWISVGAANRKPTVFWYNNPCSLIGIWQKLSMKLAASSFRDGRMQRVFP